MLFFHYGFLHFTFALSTDTWGYFFRCDIIDVDSGAILPSSIRCGYVLILSGKDVDRSTLLHVRVQILTTRGQILLTCSVDFIFLHSYIVYTCFSRDFSSLSSWISLSLSMLWMVHEYHFQGKFRSSERSSRREENIRLCSGEKRYIVHACN